MIRMYQILERPTKARDEYTPIKWSFVAHGARYTRAEAQAWVNAYTNPDRKFRIIAI